MGQGIAFRLIQCGYRVYVWNRSRVKAAALLAEGAIWAESPAAAARYTTVIFAMVQMILHPKQCGWVQTAP